MTEQNEQPMDEFLDDPLAAQDDEVARLTAERDELRDKWMRALADAGVLPPSGGGIARAQDKRPWQGQRKMLASAMLMQRLERLGYKITLCACEAVPRINLPHMMCRADPAVSMGICV